MQIINFLTLIIIGKPRMLNISLNSFLFFLENDIIALLFSWTSTYLTFSLPTLLFFQQTRWPNCGLIKAERQEGHTFTFFVLITRRAHVIRTRNNSPAREKVFPNIPADVISLSIVSVGKIFVSLPSSHVVSWSALLNPTPRNDISLEFPLQISITRGPV